MRPIPFKADGLEIFDELPGRGRLVNGETVVAQKKPLPNEKVAVEAQDTQSEAGGFGSWEPQSVGTNLEMYGEIVCAIIHKAHPSGN